MWFFKDYIKDANEKWPIFSRNYKERETERERKASCGKKT
jgi:hypothetical protein